MEYLLNLALNPLFFLYIMQLNYKNLLMNDDSTSPLNPLSLFGPFPFRNINCHPWNSPYYCSSSFQGIFFRFNFIWLAYKVALQFYKQSTLFVLFISALIPNIPSTRPVNGICCLNTQTQEYLGPSAPVQHDLWVLKSLYRHTQHTYMTSSVYLSIPCSAILPPPHHPSDREKSLKVLIRESGKDKSP